MNIYFACSITGGRQDESAYQKIVEALLRWGHEVPTAHLASSEVLVAEAEADPDEIYARDIAWIDACDALIGEVSTPSHGVGYEISYALGLPRPVLCCYQEGRTISKMILGNPSPLLQIRSYRSAEEAVAAVEWFLSQVEGDISHRETANTTRSDGP